MTLKIVCKKTLEYLKNMQYVNEPLIFNRNCLCFLKLPCTYADARTHRTPCGEADDDAFGFTKTNFKCRR